MISHKPNNIEFHPNIIPIVVIKPKDEKDDFEYVTNFPILTKNKTTTIKTNEQPEKPSPFLSLKVTQKLLRKLLTCERVELREVQCPKYTKKEIANILQISVGELERIQFGKSGYTLVPVINLALIKLFCATKFVDKNNQK